MSGDIKRSMVIQVGEQDGRTIVAISMVVSAGEHQRSKVISAAPYDTSEAAWRAVREFASARQLEHVEELVHRDIKPENQEAPVAGPDAPF